MAKKKKSNELGYRPCVGIVVLNQDNKVWIGRRAGSKRAHEPEGEARWWQMPQGGIDEGEEPRLAALRELNEETGILDSSVEIIAEAKDWYHYDLPEELIGKKWGGRYRGQTQKWFVMRFSGRDEDVNITPAPPHEIEFDAWRWAAPGELLDLIVPFKRQVYEGILEEFADLLALR